MVVEVKIDVTGKVVSASAVSGNEYLRKSSEKAAVEWKFAAAKEGPKERIARLTFAYRHADAAEPGRANGEVTTVFMPPYRVEGNPAFRYRQLDETTSVESRPRKE